MNLMKKLIFAAILTLGAAAPLCAADTNVLADDHARSSYAIGMMLGNSWKQQGLDLDNNLVLRGLNDIKSGGPTLLTTQEMSATLDKFKQDLMAKQQQLRAATAGKNKADGEAFLAKNKTAPGVITLADGLQYKVLTAGTGPLPTPEDTVTVNYRGTFIDGTEFDSSTKTGHPAQFQANRVIRGWTEALTQMKVGSKWQLFIPADLAYGEAGRPGIPPASTLIFEVELIGTQPPAAQSAAQPASPPLTSDIIKVPSAAEIKKGAKIEVIKQADAEKLQQQGK